MKQSKFGFGVLCVSLSVLVASCSKTSDVEPSPTPTPSTSVSSPTSSASTSPTPTQSSTSSVSPSPSVTAKVPIYLYVVGDTGVGLRLYREVHRYPAGTDRGLAALRFLLNERFEPSDNDYSNLWANGSTVNSVTRNGSVATVDLNISPLNVGAEGEARAIDQLVWTLTANDYSIKSVNFRHNGKVIDSFAGHMDTTGSFQRGSALEILASVWVNSLTVHANGEVVAAGVACTFEAAVPWRLYRSGDLVRSGMTMAAGACPVRGAWKVILRDVPNGDYVFVAKDLSPKDGSVVSQDSKAFSVR